MPQFARPNFIRSGDNRGFTLIEVLIISPIVILLIGVTVGYIASLTGDSLKTRERVAMSGNTQAALDTIEESALRATSFIKETGALTPPQGSDNGTARFVAANGSSGVLIMKLPATTLSYTNPARNTVRTISPADCDALGGASENNPRYMFTEAFFVRDGTLWKRTILENASGNVCDEIYQQSSCTTRTGTAPCLAEDEKILENVSNLSVLYISPAGVSIEPNSSMFMNNGGYQKISVTITTSKQVAGESISSTMKLTVKSKNI